MARKYTQKKRAKLQEETRQRIVEAAVALHETLGPARTTITDVAERAGVGRVTVYRHFPDESALLAACSGHYWENHPFPDTGPWQSIDDPRERMKRALQDSYAYHRLTEIMMTKALADVADSPVFQPYLDHWNGAADVIASAWNFAGQDYTLLRAAIGHALSFTTWRSLIREQGLTDEQAVEVMLRLG